MPNNTEWSKNYQYLKDEGPIYAETNLNNIVVEPWNGVSSLTFLIPAIYWLSKIKWSPRNDWFLFTCAILLILGGLGSAFFHAFRVSRFFILLDVLPIILLCLAASIYLWHKVFKQFWLVLIVVVVLFCCSYYIFRTPQISEHDKINLNYFIRGVFIFCPTFILLFRNRFKGWWKLVLALMFLSLALYFRKIDSYEPPLLHMGTHWLWHVACALGAYFMGEYVFLLPNDNKDDSAGGNINEKAR